MAQLLDKRSGLTIDAFLPPLHCVDGVSDPPGHLFAGLLAGSLDVGHQSAERTDDITNTLCGLSIEVIQSRDLPSEQVVQTLAKAAQYVLQQARGRRGLIAACHSDRPRDLPHRFTQALLDRARQCRS